MRRSITFSIAMLAVGCVGLPNPPGVVDESTGEASASSTGEGATSVADGSTGDTGNTDPTDGSVCGDGIVEGVEECDLGPDNGAGDYCRGDCQNNVCGDGYLGPGEACDDGNESNDDNCTSACGLASCGDGAIQPGEECDEGAANSTSGACLPSCIQASCGDQYVHEGVEACDGNRVGMSTCSSEGFDGGTLLCSDDCQSFDTSNCFVCGNGMLEANEECDGSADDLTCMAFGYDDGEVVCTMDCAVDISGCSICGNGMTEGPEVCDGADLGGQSCESIDPAYGGGMLACAPNCGEYMLSGCCFGGMQPCARDSDCCSNNCLMMMGGGYCA